MSNTINLEITTPEDRDALIEHLKGMSFDKKVESWEDLGDISGWLINSQAQLMSSGTRDFPTTSVNKNTWATKEQAEASVAMAQLSQLMKFYNDGWTPDWSSEPCKYIIHTFEGDIASDSSRWTSFFLAFKTEAIRDKFLENHRDLIEQAKPLL